ncbi:PepSY domain-containing protein [Neobacillus sp. SCS-31]|uniref:PepSY domain-containing protein n=1 Tax=Neobacillus oceani TaxID=3115292 RepID=UPI00390646A4
MGKKWGFITLFSSLLILSALVGWLLLKPEDSSAEAISKQEAKKLVENRYGGNVTLLQAEEQLYYVRLDIKNQSYWVKIDSKTGKILSIERIGTINEEDPPPSLSEDEIKKLILSKAAGELISFNKTESGGRPVFVGVVRDTDENKTTVTVDVETGNVVSEKTTPANPPKRVTENEAIAAAQKEVNGEIDDVDIETESGQTFYLIEIKTPDDNEATVQIHAITGEVMAVTWDD